MHGHSLSCPIFPANLHFCFPCSFALFFKKNPIIIAIYNICSTTNRLDLPLSATHPFLLSSPPLAQSKLLKTGVCSPVGKNAIIDVLPFPSLCLLLFLLLFVASLLKHRPHPATVPRICDEQKYVPELSMLSSFFCVHAQTEKILLLFIHPFFHCPFCTHIIHTLSLDTLNTIAQSNVHSSPQHI